MALLGASFSFARLVQDGFLALSDDDYSRVVIAQEFSRSASLDPSKTSWLPAPFWIYGGVMKLAPSTLETARTTAFVLALGASLVLFRAARLLRVQGSLAALATIAIAWLPTARPLAVATVPEFPTHALVAYGLVALATRRDLALAGLGLLVATLSRYETWPAAGVAALVATAVIPRARADGRKLAAFAVLAVLGPLLWCAHGSLHHESALFFVKRVVDYKAALGAEARAPLELLTSVPRALVESEPEAFLFGLFALAIGWKRFDEGKPLRAALLPLLGLIAFLVLGDYRGGAPTHHPERTLLCVWMMAILLGAGVLGRVDLRRRGMIAVGSLLASIPFRVASVPPSFGARPEEEEVGRFLRAQLPSDERIVVATTDYGYFAVLAAAGNPRRFTVLETHDPRHREVPMPIPPRIVARAAADGACYAVLPLCVEMPGIVSLRDFGAFSVAKLTREDCRGR